MKRYVQYGCGFTAPNGWINYDASPTLRFEKMPLLGKFYTRNSQRFPASVKYGNIVKGLPEQANSCDGVYCSHVLEHLAYADFVQALKNTYTILKPGGVFRGVVPDLKAAVTDYLDTFNTEPAPANNLMRGTMLGIETRGTGLAAAVKGLYGNSKHLWMWDYKSLAHELEKVGFKNICPITFGDADDAAFALVEEEDRFYKAAAFQCQK
ncbi:MAG: methyltransferase domain-containing protein [Bacteroidota bacterium]